MSARIAVTFVASFIAMSYANNVQAQASAPIRELALPTATSSERFGTILTVRALSDGSVLVDDGTRRQVSLLDATLRRRKIVIDSISTGGQSYGQNASPLLPYRGDSTLFVDRESISLLVISPSGAIVRTIAPPKPSDLGAIGSSPVAIDALGNIVYRGAKPRPSDVSGQPTGFLERIQQPDSAPVVRANIETRLLDTLGAVKTSTQQRIDTTVESTRSVYTIMVNPVTTVDDWAMLSDGSVAFVRGHDYHVDFVRRDGTHYSAPKLPFDWKHITDADKQALMDSVRAVRDKQEAEAKKKGTGGTSATLSGGNRVMVRSAAQSPFKFDVVPMSEIVDYWPPIRPGAASADLDGNLWILPTTSAQSKNGELVYDVVNNQGVLTGRVRLPVGRSIATFGRDGAVYLISKDDNGWLLERTKVVADGVKR